mmetsp:Transcript_90093/g.233675  ORF Transcript_90093/g.233675 Transcript_90093/m.233675 type:complete len:358 (-) Transcript_90093:39-1112(-)
MAARQFALLWCLWPSIVATTTKSEDSCLLQVGTRSSSVVTETGESESPNTFVDRASHLVDLVVERHCEDLGWLQDISSDVRPLIKVLVYDKSGGDCARADAQELPRDMHVVVKELKNVARDGHDQLYHIVTNYDNLAPYTAFVQAGFHWTLRGIEGKGAHGWNSQAAALNDLVPRLAKQHVPFLPFTMYTKYGPVLWQDREDDTDPDFPPEVNVLKFSTGWSDMYQKARELYSLLFGGTPCEAKGQAFTAGMQYIVARENIKARPLAFYQQLKEDIVNCDPTLGYVFERLTTAIFNSTDVWQGKSVADRATWCRHDLNWQVFTTPLKVMETSKFWKEHWGCEPLSQRLLDMHAAGKI